MPDAFTKLSRMTAASSEPKLSNEEIEDLLAQFRIADADGVAPGEDGWVPTYNLRAAAREGWSWKMARASDLISTDLDGDRMSANQVFEHCERMHKRYSRGSAAISTALYAGDDDDD